MLSDKLYDYFTNITKKVKNSLHVHVHILPLDHSQFLEDGENIQGSCHRFFDNQGFLVKTVITIDENYIRACYFGRQTLYSQYSDLTLIETICHEIAHLFIWEHGVSHDQLTAAFYDKVTK